MKKIFSTILLPFILIYLCACQGEQKEPSDSIIANDFISNFENGEGRRYIKNGVNFYENGLISSKNPVYYTDFDSLETIPFCNMPNCAHNSSSCFAQNLSSNPIVYKNNVFFFNSISSIKEVSGNREFNISSKLMKASLTTFEVVEVCEFTDCMPNIPEYYVLDENVIYFTGNNMNPSADEYGNILYSNVGGNHYLCSINLDTGKYTNYGSIYDDDKEYKMSKNSSGANITGIYENKMFIQYVFMKDDPAELGIPSEENWTRINFEYDFHTQKLLESNLPAAIYVDNDTYVYLDSKLKDTVIIEKGKTRHIPHYDLAVQNAKVVNGKIFFADSWFDINDAKEHKYNELEGYEVIIYYKEHYILQKGNEFIKLTEDELLALE